MEIKDHYKILELAPSATLEEIKKAYRRLVLLYHPDKKPGDPYAASRFSEIKEAYETLTDPRRKERYLQQRWYNQSMGIKTKQEATTPVNVLTSALALNRYVSKLDIHRMDRKGLYAYIFSMITDEKLEVLNSFGEISINSSITRSILDSSRLLSYNDFILVTEQLKKLNVVESVEKDIQRARDRLKKHDAWTRNKIWVVLLVTIAVCLLIFAIV